MVSIKNALFTQEGATAENKPDKGVFGSDEPNRAVSTAGVRSLHTGKVTGSIPVPPTKPAAEALTLLPRSRPPVHAPERGKPKYVSSETNRHGTRVYYFRRKGQKIRLPNEFGTPEFYEAYNIALSTGAALVTPKASKPVRTNNDKRQRIGISIKDGLLRARWRASEKGLSFDLNLLKLIEMAESQGLNISHNTGRDRSAQIFVAVACEVDFRIKSPAWTRRLRAPLRQRQPFFICCHCRQSPSSRSFWIGGKVRA